VVTIGEYFCHSICSSGPGLNFNFEPAWVPTKQGDLNWNLASGPTSIRETRVCMVAQSTHVLLSIIYSCFVNGLRLACYMLPLMLGALPVFICQNILPSKHQHVIYAYPTTSLDESANIG
jgi:hypothetical protein